MGEGGGGGERERRRRLVGFFVAKNIYFPVFHRCSRTLGRKGLDQFSLKVIDWTDNLVSDRGEKNIKVSERVIAGALERGRGRRGGADIRSLFRARVSGSTPYAGCCVSRAQAGSLRSLFSPFIFSFLSSQTRWWCYLTGIPHTHTTMAGKGKSIPQ